VILSRSAKSEWEKSYVIEKGLGVRSKADSKKGSSNFTRPWSLWRKGGSPRRNEGSKKIVYAGRILHERTTRGPVRKSHEIKSRVEVGHGQRRESGTLEGLYAKSPRRARDSDDPSLRETSRGIRIYEGTGLDSGLQRIGGELNGPHGGKDAGPTLTQPGRLKWGNDLLDVWRRGHSSQRLGD